MSAVWKPPSWKARFTVTSDRGTEGSLPGSFTPSSDQAEQRLEVSRFCPREASEQLRSLHVRCPWSSSSLRHEAETPTRLWSWGWDAPGRWDPKALCVFGLHVSLVTGEDGGTSPPPVVAPALRRLSRGPCHMRFSLPRVVVSYSHTNFTIWLLQVKPAQPSRRMPRRGWRGGKGGGGRSAGSPEGRRPPWPG